jgi:Putative Ig domain
MYSQKSLFFIIFAFIIPSTGFAAPPPVKKLKKLVTTLAMTGSYKPRPLRKPPSLMVRPKAGIPISNVCKGNCLNPNNFYQMKTWCNSQTFCSYSRYGYRSSYRKKYYKRSYGSSSCPYTCFDPNRDYNRMKAFCMKQSYCKVNQITPEQVIRQNYSINNKLYQKAGKKLEFKIDNKGSNHKWSVSGLPKGATFNKKTLTFYWKPKSYQTGFHFVTFTCAPGKPNVYSKTIKIKVKEEWEAFFLPGLHYTTYIPNNMSKYGIFHGVSLNYTLLAWVHRNEKRGPSHGRIYFKLDILSSTEKDYNNKEIDLLYYAMGVDLSFERNPRRPFLIPFFGLEMGGSYSSSMFKTGETTGTPSTDIVHELGGVFHITPTFGIYLWSDRNFSVTITGGYTFPTSDYDNLKGWRIYAGMNFTMW